MFLDLLRARDTHLSVHENPPIALQFSTNITYSKLCPKERTLLYKGYHHTSRNLKKANK